MEEGTSEEVMIQKDKKMFRMAPGWILFGIGIFLLAASIMTFVGLLAFGIILSFILTNSRFSGLADTGIIVTVFGIIATIIIGVISVNTSIAGWNMVMGRRRRFVTGMLYLLLVLSLLVLISSTIRSILTGSSDGWWIIVGSLFFTAVSVFCVFVLHYSWDTFVPPEEEKYSSKISDKGYAEEIEKERKLMEECEKLVSSEDRYEFG